MADRYSPLTEYFHTAGHPLLTLPGGGAVTLRFGDEIAEHLATRHACGLYDFSFMGAWDLAGKDAISHLQRLQTRDLRSIKPGQIAYTLMCRDDGTIFNDATVWMIAPERYWLFSGRKSDSDWVMSEVERQETQVRQMDADLAVLALQGPHCGRLLATLVGENLVRDLSYFRFADTELFGEPCRLARIGYSGELGYEIIVAAEQGARIWPLLRSAGRHFGLLECGFNAANSLRIESGYILFSHELARPRRPVEVGLQHLVKSDSPDMRGRSALLTSREQISTYLVCADISPEKCPPGNAPALELTSEAYSPLFGTQLGLGFVDPEFKTPGTMLRTQDGTRVTLCAFPRHDPARQRPRGSPFA